MREKANALAELESACFTLAHFQRAKDEKRLASEWCVSEASLKNEVEPLERERIKVERFRIGEYYVEVEERVDPVHGLMWDAWIGRGRVGTKSYMIGILADNTEAKEPHIYTHDEALELIFAQFDLDAKIFDDEVETLENAFEERRSKE